MKISAGFLSANRSGLITFVLGEGGWVSDKLTFVFTREPEAEQRSVRVVRDALVVVARPLHCWISPSQTCVEKGNAAAVSTAFCWSPRPSSWMLIGASTLLKPFPIFNVNLGFLFVHRHERAGQKKQINCTPGKTGRGKPSCRLG